MSRALLIGLVALIIVSVFPSFLGTLVKRVNASLAIVVSPCKNTAGQPCAVMPDSNRVN